MAEPKVTRVVVDDADLEGANVEAIPVGELVEDQIQGYEPDRIEASLQDAIDKYFPLPDDFPLDQIEKWKAQFKNLRVRRMGPKQAYVVRPLLRGELEMYYRLINQSEENRGDVRASLAVEEELVARCTLYPDITPEMISGLPEKGKDVNPIAVAGVASVLAADILFISFMIEESLGPVEDL
jgi:hypothetical protein